MAQEYVYWNPDHTDKSYADEGYTHHTAPRTGEWTKSAGNGHVDHHAYRPPAIVDSQGTKRPVVIYPGSNGDTYVTTETVVERYRPTVTEYRYSYPVKTEEYKRYSSPEMAPNEPKCGYPVRMEYKPIPPPVRVEEYKHNSPERAAEENRYGCPLRIEYKLSSPGKVDEQKYGFPIRVEYYKRTAPVRVDYTPGKVDEHVYGHTHPVRVEEYRLSSASSPAREPVHDRPPPEVRQFITKIQTDVSQVPARARPGPLTALNWRQTHNGGGIKTNSNGIARTRSDSYDDDNDDRRNDKTREPIITSGVSWPVPGSKLSGPTNDIGAAVEILKDVAMGSSAGPGHHVRFGHIVPASTGPKYTTTIDSKTAEEKYNGATLID